MTTPTEEIENPVTGERIAFRRTAAHTRGELLEFDDFWTRPDHRVAEHVHPEIEERWEVIFGAVRFRIAGVEQTARPGDVVVAPTATPHMSWNVSEGPAHLRVQMRPALRWEEFTRRLFAAAREGHTDDQGIPKPRLLAELFGEFHREIAPPS
jgi:mannose-6-phosphate isomerase-like protein (cupin superfamily)